MDTGDGYSENHICEWDDCNTCYVCTVTPLRGCTMTELSNGFLDGRCRTDDAEYFPACANEDLFSYCHPYQVDVCDEGIDYPRGGDYPFRNPGLEPDGVWGSCEHHEDGMTNVVCCRDHPIDLTLQCTAMHSPGSTRMEDCITHGPNRDGNTDALFRQHRYMTPYPELVAGKIRNKPFNQTHATWSFAHKTCTELEGGNEGWRLCYPEEVRSGACCEAASGVSVCGFGDEGVWTAKFCDSYTTCQIVETFAHTSDGARNNRGDPITDTWKEIWCTYDGEGEQYTSNRNHLCDWHSSTKQCLPKADVKIMDDNSGDRGYWILLLESAFSLVDFTYRDFGFDITNSYKFIQANLTKSEIAFWEPCESHSPGIGLDYCVYEVVKYHTASNLKLYNPNYNWTGVPYQTFDFLDENDDAATPSPTTYQNNNGACWSQCDEAAGQCDYCGTGGACCSTSTSCENCDSADCRVGRTMSGSPIGTANNHRCTQMVPGAGGRRLLLEKRKLNTWVSPQVIVYVVDSGVQSTHDLFEGNVLEGYDVYADLPGQSSGTEDQYDHQGHGTHVAGIIYQVNPRIKIIPVSIFDKTGYVSGEKLYESFEHIVEDIQRRRGIDDHERYIINMSICAPGEAKSLYQAIFNILKGLGAILIAAACNDSGPIQYNMFGNYDSTYAVASRSRSNKLSKFSGWDSYGFTIALGEDVVSAMSRTQSSTHVITGTSQATPFVSGVVSKIWELHPDYSVDQIMFHYGAYCTANRVNDIDGRHPFKNSVNGNYPHNDAYLNRECLHGAVVPCTGDNCSESDVATFYVVPVDKVSEVTSTTDYPEGVDKLFFLDVHISTLGAAIPTRSPTTGSPTVPTAPTTSSPTFGDISTASIDEEVSSTSIGATAGVGGAVALGIIYWLFCSGGPPPEPVPRYERLAMRRVL